MQVRKRNIKQKVRDTLLEYDGGENDVAEEKKMIKAESRKWD